MKSGLLYSDWLSTVSPRYALEIQTPEFGFGLDGVLRTRSANLTGILNGADYEHWDPETDPHIAANYSVDDMAGKDVCKRDLIERMGLDGLAMERPLIGIVSRLSHQKGFDLFGEMSWALMNEHVSLAVLGSGEPPYENVFRAIHHAFPGRVGLHIGYDEDLAHRIYAGSDLFLMPSRYEPCGLSQIYSLRYGTLPVVRATGGLDDTIEEDSGFKFHGYSPWALMDAVRAATSAWWDPERRERMIRSAMTKDYSWTASAGHYVDLYQRLAG
jgi:starch synthase